MNNLIRKYRDKSNYDLSCSESIIYAANEYYELNLPKEALYMMAPFSGGLFEKELCGIITGCVAVLGILFTNGVAHKSEILEKAVIEFKSAFKEKYGTSSCNTLYEDYRDEIVGCDNLIYDGVILLQEIVTKYK